MYLAAMFFLPKDLDDYIVNSSQQEPQILRDLTRETHLKVLKPIMLSGAYQGRVLSMISHLCAPKRVLEIGTFTGYSAICLMEGMPDGSELVTIDINEELEDMAVRYFDRFRESVKTNITIHQKIGDATKIIPDLKGTFDLIFIDADKSNYVTYFHQVMDKVNPGALILTDNVLWHGKVVNPIDHKDTTTPILMEYNKLINRDPRLQTVVLPVRDGLTLSRVGQRV